MNGIKGSIADRGRGCEVECDGGIGRGKDG